MPGYCINSRIHKGHATIVVGKQRGTKRKVGKPYDKKRGR